MKTRRIRHERRSTTRWIWGGGLALAALTAAAGGAAAADEPDDGAVFDRPTYSSPIALSADDRLVWVVNPGDDSVSVLRADTNTVLKKIKVGDEPQSVALDPNNRFAVVANAADSSVSAIKITNAEYAGFKAAVDKTVKTGAEPWNVVVSPDGKRVFVANSGQDTITVLDAVRRRVIGQVDLRDSLCNDSDDDDLDGERHFQPRGLAVTQDSTRLYVTRFLSFTADDGKQGDDAGKEGVVCRLDIDTSAENIGGYQPAAVVRLAAELTGFAIGDPPVPGTESTAFPNQLQSIVIRGDRAFLPNIAASPEGPLQFQNSSQAYVNFIDQVSGDETVPTPNKINLHLGARDPEPGKTKLFFANPWAIAFTTQSGPGTAYAVSAGSDLLVKLNVDEAGQLSFTVDEDTTRYVDLNDPNDPATSGDNAGKNPQGIAITADGAHAYVANFVSRNVSKVDLNQDKVVAVERTTDLPDPGSKDEEILVGAEMFFSSRGHFDRPQGTIVSTDQRLSKDGWQNCASCHFKGWTDGVVWAFASGPRKSVNLAGSFNPHEREQQKIFNYSGIFDEVQDFEANIRNISGPGPLAAPLPCALPVGATSTNDPNQGLLIGDNGDINLAPCVVNQFTLPNAGRQGVTVTLPGSTEQVQALDALKKWVQFAVRVPNGPLTDAEIAGGVPAGDVQQGRQLFKEQQCTACHAGGLWSTSVKDFTSPPANNQIACEVNLMAAAPPGSFCLTPPAFGNPPTLQYLFRFLEDVGSFNLGVEGGNNPIDDDVGGVEKAAPAIVGGMVAAPPDALGIDYNRDGKGEGFNVQSLLGVHNVQPYMHNGACETLACVVGDKDHRTANGRLPDKLAGADQQAKVVKFVESIDARTKPFK